jgi:hypothetical protein
MYEGRKTLRVGKWTIGSDGVDESLTLEQALICEIQLRSGYENYSNVWTVRLEKKEQEELGRSILGVT